MARRSEGWRLRQTANSPYWFVRFTHEGKRIERSTGCTTAGKAKEAAEKIYADTLRGIKPQTVRHGSLEDALSEWLVVIEDTRSSWWHSTVERYAHSEWLSRWSDVSELTTKNVQRYVSERLASNGQRDLKTGKARKLSSVTLSKELSALRTFLTWCKSHGWIDTIPTWEAPKPVSDYQRPYPTPTQAAAIIAELPDKRTHPRHYPIREYYTVVWATSFRKNTMAQLRWDDVDFEAGTITVRASADKKRHGRTVPLTVDAIAALNGLRGDGKAGKVIALIFGRRDFRRSLREAAKRVRPALPKELLETISDHAFRHGRLTDLASRSQNIAAIQHMAGHKDLASTMRYVHGSLDNARALLSELGENSGGIVGGSGRRRKRKRG